MINDILTGLEKISFQGWLAIWLVVALFVFLNKLSSYVDAKLSLMRAQEEAANEHARLGKLRYEAEVDRLAKANRL